MNNLPVRILVLGLLTFSFFISEGRADECTEMRARLAPHAPSQAWLDDQLRRSGFDPSCPQSGGGSRGVEEYEIPNRARIPARKKTQPAPPKKWGAVAAYDDIFGWARGDSEEEARRNALAACRAKGGKCGESDVKSVQPNVCVCIFTVNYTNNEGKHRTMVYAHQDYLSSEACEASQKACYRDHPSSECRPEEEHCANTRK
jgi:hypothetical protein